MSRVTVAIVGAGIFGSLAAVRLAQNGFAVTLIDFNDTPMQGASLNNQNRLHLGFHYPRSVETAEQCIAGYGRFLAEYGDCVRNDFQNCYAIASNGSLTSPEDYLAFCDQLGLEYRVINAGEADIRVRNVDLVIETGESIYDAKALAAKITASSQSLGIETVFNTEVIESQSDGDGISLIFGDGTSRSFDAVLNSTYANQNRLDRSMGFGGEERQYEFTAVPIISIDNKTAGMTVMDGRFLTMLPFGFSDNMLLYHVEESVLETQVTSLLSPDWLGMNASPWKNIDQDALFERFRQRCMEYLPDVEHARCVGFLKGPRMVLKKSDKTDERPTIVEAHAPNYMSVFSGKTDHAPVAAEEILAHFKALQG